MSRALSAGVRLALVVLLALATPASAQSPARAMSLREAIAFARAHQPSLEAARARVAVAREQASVPRAAWTPRIVAGAELLVGTNNNTTTSYGGALGFDVPRIGGTPANAATSYAPDPSTLVGVGVHQEIYDAGRLTAQADALDLFARAAEEDARLADLDLTLYVEDAFYAVVSAHAVVQAAEAAVQRATTHRDFAKARVSAQLEPPLTLTRAEADLARYDVDRIRALGNLATAQAVLAAAIGAPDTAIDAGADDVSYATSPSLAAAIAELEQRDPALRAADDNVRAQQQVTRSIHAELLPEISLSATVTGRAGGADVATETMPLGNGWLPDVPNWDALVVVSWPLFDRTVDARARASREIEHVRGAELADLREQLHGRAAQAVVALQVAADAMPALERSVDAARANQAQADARFTGGLGNAVELADAEALLTDAEIQLAIGRFQLARARARLARVTAEPTPGSADGSSAGPKEPTP